MGSSYRAAQVSLQRLETNFLEEWMLSGRK